MLTTCLTIALLFSIAANAEQFVALKEAKNQRAKYMSIAVDLVIEEQKEVLDGLARREAAERFIPKDQRQHHQGKLGVSWGRPPRLPETDPAGPAPDYAPAHWNWDCT